MKLLSFIFAFVVLLTFFSCQSKKQQENSEQKDIVAEGVIKGNKYRLIPVEDSPNFPDAVLEIDSPSNGDQLVPGDIHFAYTVKNYTLTSQTEDASNKHCANSTQGQHIHLILNNEPYSAHYEKNFIKPLDSGHYVALSFLSRSYHESLKHPSAYTLTSFTVGGVNTDTAINLEAPMLFYSRPKGEYQGKDTKRVLLDFYLVNANLGVEGYKVSVTINNEDSFLIEEWKPYFIEGLSMGENTITIKLLDNDGSMVEGPFSTVTRTITLKE